MTSMGMMHEETIVSGAFSSQLQGACSYKQPSSQYLCAGQTHLMPGAHLSPGPNGLLSCMEGPANLDSWSDPSEMSHWRTVPSAPPAEVREVKHPVLNPLSCSDGASIVHGSVIPVQVIHIRSAKHYLLICEGDTSDQLQESLVEPGQHPVTRFRSTLPCMCCLKLATLCTSTPQPTTSALPPCQRGVPLLHGNKAPQVPVPLLPLPGSPDRRTLLSLHTLSPLTPLYAGCPSAWITWGPGRWAAIDLMAALPCKVTISHGAGMPPVCMGLMPYPQQPTAKSV
jgi:hypothetical protein